MSSSSVSWTRQEDKVLENVIGAHGYGNPSILELAVEKLPGKTQQQILDRLLLLPGDIERIEAGLAPLADEYKDDGGSSVAAAAAAENQSEGGDVGKKRKRWTAEEHNLYLRGYQVHGRNWSKISKEFVKTKTAQQVRDHGTYYLALGGN